MIQFTALALALSSAAAFAAMAWDKSCAKRGKRRVPESRFVWLVLAGGLLGLWLGAKTFRHKTVKRTFHWKIAAGAAGWLAWVGLGAYLLA